MDRPSPFGEQVVNDQGVIICPGCAPVGECQLGVVRQEVRPDGGATASVCCPPNYEGGPGVALGGWIAMVFDHLFGTIPMRLSIGGLTVSLTTDFLAPVPIGVPVTVHAHTVERTGRAWKFAAEMLLPDGSVAATARCDMVEPSARHFDRYRRD